MQMTFSILKRWFCRLSNVSWETFRFLESPNKKGKLYFYISIFQVWWSPFSCGWSNSGKYPPSCGCLHAEKDKHTRGHRSRVLDGHWTLMITTHDITLFHQNTSHLLSYMISHVLHHLFYYAAFASIEVLMLSLSRTYKQMIFLDGNAEVTLFR